MDEKEDSSFCPEDSSFYPEISSFYPEILPFIQKFFLLSRNPLPFIQKEEAFQKCFHFLFFKIIKIIKNYQLNFNKFSEK
jgi:hypothetical protein